MTERAPETGNSVSATVVSLVPETVEAELPQPSVLTPAVPSVPGPEETQSLVTDGGLYKTLTLRLQRLTTHTLPIAWYRLTRVGAFGMVGAAATLAAIVIAALAMVNGRQAADALSARIADVQAHSGGRATDDAGLGKVVAALPRRQAMPAVLGQVFEQARAANVALDNGHYTYSAPKAGSTVGRYELEFPVKATYPNVREFINRTLSTVPSAGLDKLRIERKVVGDPVVSADIRFVVFVHAEP